MNILPGPRRPGAHLEAGPRQAPVDASRRPSTTGDQPHGRGRRSERTRRAGRDQPEAGRRGLGPAGGRMAHAWRARRGERRERRPRRDGRPRRPRPGPRVPAASRRPRRRTGATAEVGREPSSPRRQPSRVPEIARSEYASGLRVVTEPMPGMRSVALGFWVDVGSRDERAHDRRGFALPRAPAVQGDEDPDGPRRSPRRSTPSAATSTRSRAKEYTCYYCRVRDGDLPDGRGAHGRHAPELASSPGRTSRPSAR